MLKASHSWNNNGAKSYECDSVNAVIIHQK